MPQILHTTLHPGRAVAAGGETFQLDLPVNPLSVILLTFRGINTAAAVAGKVAIPDFLNKYTNINVRYRGASIIDGNASDLLVEMMARPDRWAYGLGQVNNTDNDIAWLTIPLLFGRRAYDPMECFPATRRGDLILDITAAADAGTLDGHTLQVETIELLDATPGRFVKATTTEQAMAAAGQNTIDLPIGNKLLGCLLRPFTFPTGAAFTSSFGEVAFEVDNVEVGYSSTNWETLHGALSRLVPPWWNWLAHVHGFVDAAAGQVNTQLGTDDFPLQQAYGYLDFDPMSDGAYAIDTRGAADISLQINSDVADGANTSRVVVRELVEIGGAQPEAA